MEQRGSQWTDFHEIWYLTIFLKFVQKIQVSLKSDKNNGYLHEDQYTFLIISCSFLLRMRNVSDKSCRGNQKIHFVFSNFFKNRTIFEIMWKNMLEQGRPQMTIWHMHIAFWIIKATHTLTICKNYCFCTATMVARTHLYVMFIHTLPVLLKVRCNYYVITTRLLSSSMRYCEVWQMFSSVTHIHTHTYIQIHTYIHTHTHTHTLCI